VWTVPLVGCGECVGEIRVAGDADWSPTLCSLAMSVSVRLAQIDDVSQSAPLTARQREVAALVARGCTNSEIGVMLGISPNTVKKHVSCAFEVLHVSNRAELAALAARWREDIASGSDDAAVRVIA
jgi:DNA-binding CsgD family transcriptional regulator